MMDKSETRRLETLPRKVALPLLHLAEIGQLQPADVAMILDAGELAGNTQHLLGFAVGALSMQARRIDIRDTVRMAKQTGKTIRLDWSPRRWSEEHDRLSRLVTFNELRQKNHVYELSKFERLLPEQFPGYLIRSRRRLAAVGFVQRHCVASYHDSIRSGSCAFVCVFIDRRRWTVQLGLHGGRLIIREIRTTDNVTPQPYVALRIHDVLGIDQHVAMDSQGQGEILNLITIANTARVVTALRAQGIASAKLTYNPEPGLLQEHEAIGFEPAPPTIDKVKIYRLVHPQDGGYRIEELECGLSDALNEKLNAMVDRYLTGWQARNSDPYQFATLTLDVDAEREPRFLFSTVTARSRSPRAKMTKADYCEDIDMNSNHAERDLAVLSAETELH